MKKINILSIIIGLACVIRTASFAEMRIYVEQHGITWTFDKGYECGQFVNGDWWVLIPESGNVVITHISPASVILSEKMPCYVNPDKYFDAGDTINGSMVNPMPISSHGYISRASNGWDPSLNAARPNGKDLSADNPLIILDPSSLVSSISYVNTPNATFPHLTTAAVLTLVDRIPPVGSFRPAYTGTNKNVRFNRSRIDYSLLSNLEPIKGTPDLANIERRFERVWLDHKPMWSARLMHPVLNMNDYDRDMSNDIGVASLMVNLKYSDDPSLNNQIKEKLVVRFIQLGIDYYGIIEAGSRAHWKGEGGFGGGRKWPILFAGLMINEPGMIAVGEKSGSYRYAKSWPAARPDDFIMFGDDDQTLYIKESDVYEPPFKLNCIQQEYVNNGRVLVQNGSNVVQGIGTSWVESKFLTSGSLKKLFFAVRYGANVVSAHAQKPEHQGYSMRALLGSDPAGSSYNERGGYDFRIIGYDIQNQRIYLGDSNGNAKPFDGYSGEYSEYVIGRHIIFGHGNSGNDRDYVEFTSADIGKPAWGIRYATSPETVGNQWETSYDWIGKSFAGYVLAVHVMDSKVKARHGKSFMEIYNHNPLFDYLDRYMDYLQGNSGQGSPWVFSMWDAYRANYGSIWVPGNIPEDSDPDLPDTPFSIIPEANELQVLNNIIKGKSSASAIKLSISLPGNAVVKIYDSKGKEVITLWDGHKEAGVYEIPWNGTDSSGKKVGSGVYMVHMKAGSYKDTKKIVIVR